MHLARHAIQRRVLLYAQRRAQRWVGSSSPCEPRAQRQPCLQEGDHESACDFCIAAARSCRAVPIAGGQRKQRRAHPQPVHAVGVKVVGEDRAAGARGGHGEGTDAGENIEDGFAGPEVALRQPRVLGL